MDSKNKVFLSLKWKVVLLLSIVLLLANGTLAMMFYLSTIEHLELQQNKNLAQQNRELQSLLQVDEALMQNFAEMLPITSYTSNSDLELAESLSSLLEENGELIYATWGIEELFYVSSKGSVLYQWLDLNYSNDLKQFVFNVMKTEEPGSLLRCLSTRCDLVVAIPVLDFQQNVNGLLLFRSLTDVFLNFVALTKADISLIKPINMSDQIEQFSESILLSSNKMELSYLLNSLTPIQFNKIKQGEKLRIKVDDEWFEMHEIVALKDNKDINFLITNRVTQLINMIENTFYKSIYVGFVGFLISEISLLLLLWYPVTRLNHVTRILPLLAKGEFFKFRELLKEQQLQRVVADEIDIVEENMINSSLQLENYQVEMYQQARALKKERDFVTKLIEGAPVIILSQTTENIVTQINKQGTDLSNVSERDLLGKNFIQALMSRDTPKSLINEFKLWTSSGSGVFHNEIKMPAFGGGFKTIHWTHSVFHNTENNEPIILSIGLDLSDRIKAEENLSWLASHDSLTELPNRRFFESSFKTILKQQVRYKHAGALLFFDLDQFKYVNDVSGHHVGDNLLKMVANEVTKLIRSSDIFARLGGDEFAIILPEANKGKSIIVANKILESLESMSLAMDGYNHKVSASIGITYFPEHGEDVNTLMTHADIAMYQAKYSGRGRWYQYTAEDKTQEILSSKAYWREKIDDALANNYFVFHFQPILNLKENKVKHYEALIRMRGDDGNLYFPDSFIPIAEQTGQIKAIDLWVITHAFYLLKDHSEIFLAVNLSSSAMTNQELVPIIKSFIFNYDISPDRIIFELTETAAVEKLNSAVSIMSDIRALGCQFALDDFGTGFSSFSYLKQLPVDLIKIDGAFVKDLDISKEDRLFVKAINDVSIGLGKKTVAEYVESEEILERLKEIGVDYAQGYFIGKPSEEFQ